MENISQQSQPLEHSTIDNVEKRIYKSHSNNVKQIYEVTWQEKKSNKPQIQLLLIKTAN